jgi:class 3 adenylate cyclase/tetratricopeptide (TPR) repeat protein
MPRAPEVRKTVTIVFTDVTGWTSLGEGLDPESLRGLMSRYFDEMRRVIEQHGGRVEKFIGDAVMAVFGVPAVREDDALRAVRAAAQMRDRVAILNAELERDFETSLQTRTGVNTGEVIVGADLGEILATGEPVTVAARLEQTASPGEILIGDQTYRLVRDAVDVEDAGPLQLKGKAAAVLAWRLVRVVPEAPGISRRLSSPIVGRERELSQLHRALDRAIADRSCRSATVVADAGVGKSRLATQFTAAVGGRATVVRGRCLPYGEGITFWPVAEVVRQLAGIDAHDGPDEAAAKVVTQLGDDPDTASIAAPIAAIVGRSDSTYPVQETFWAVRKMFESVARLSPLVVAFDDIHWGESTFLDLLEYLCGWSAGAPILIVCAARPELIERRPGWGTGNANVESMTLEPLTADSSNDVIDNLLGGGELDAAARARIADVAEGNPLFIEEIVRMLVDDGRLGRENDQATSGGAIGDFDIPPTVNALLDARLEAIPADERIVLQRASIMGKLFSWTAVAELSPKEARPRTGAQLQALVRRAMIHPERAEFAGEDGFAFSHVLVRDAAYRSIPKKTRAKLHSRFARWLEAKAQSTFEEYDEVIGYHLEQAYRCRVELGPASPRDDELASRGAVRLAAAGSRALARNDLPATISLLSRAADLLTDDDPLWLEVAPDLAEALAEAGAAKRARDLFAEAARRADAFGDPRLLAHITLQRWHAFGEGDLADLRRDADAALAVFAAASDDRGMSRAWRALGDVEYKSGRVAARDRMMERALDHARKAGDARELVEIHHTMCVDMNLGPTHALEGIRRCEELLAAGEGGRGVAASASHALAHLRSMRGEFDEAFALADRFRSILRDDGAMSSYWFFAEVPFNIQMLAGQTQQAVETLTEANDQLARLGEPASVIDAMLSQALYAVGDLDAARRRAEAASASSDGDVVSARFQARGVLAKILARDGDYEAAQAMARESVAFFEQTEFVVDHGNALMDLGEVLQRAGRASDAHAVVSDAIDLFDRKGDIVSAGKARRLLQLRG